MVQRFSITLTQLTYFAECAKTLNMTVASQDLHVAQSAVSTAITNLERELGVSLFIRQHSKGLVLTEAGESLLRDTHLLFGRLTDTIESLRSDQSSVRGSITIACFSTLAPFLLPRLLAKLQKDHPELVVEVLEGDYEENLAALRGGRAELAINYDLSDAEGIASTVVGEARPYVVVAEGHPFAARASVALPELADESLVLLDLPHSREYFLDILRGAGVKPQVRYRSTSYEAVRSMVGAGLGYTILNQRPLTDDTYSGGRTVTVEIDGEVPSLRIAITSLEQLKHSARARVVAGAVRELLAI